MIRPIVATTALCLTLSGLALAQTDGLSAEIGPAFVTKSGKLPFGTSAIKSDAGWAIRGKLRYGVGALSIAGEIQTSNQNYGSSGSGVPSDLNATYLGVLGTLRPLKISALEPYLEVGLGRLSFSDKLIAGKNGSHTASTYGLGLIIAPGSGRIALDTDLRLVRQTDLQFSGVGTKFKYDPKVFTAMVLVKL